MNKVVFVILFAVFGLFFSGTVKAAENCIPIYGGGNNCLPQRQLIVDNKVQSPKTKNFVDNLSREQAEYLAGDTIKFQLTIINKGITTLSKVEVIDKLPALVQYTSGPGTYDAKSQTLRFNLDNLKQNETRKFIISGIVQNVSKNTCSFNIVEAKSGNIKADDNSNFCFWQSVCEDGKVKKTTIAGGNRTTTKGGFPVLEAPKVISKTPATGPELLPLISLIPIATAGFYLRKRSSR